MSSPRSWGCFLPPRPQDGDALVFPTLVGVFPPWITSKRTTPRLPHARGGVSYTSAVVEQEQRSSPRSWGCFSLGIIGKALAEVFPTLVGVFLFAWPVFPRKMGLPHARGGVSTWATLWPQGRMSSPRSWGCFRDERRDLTREVVFPTLVGVFPPCPLSRAVSWGLPHARGGVSLMSYLRQSSGWSSPRSWGCFPCIDHAFIIRSVFPTLVGVFPRQSPAWGTIRSKWELLHVLCPYSKEINANGTLLKRRKKASYRANFLLIVPMLYRFKKYF